jgi:hypothetical protein
MTWLRKITFIFSAPFQILLVTMIIAVMFGIMDSQATLVSNSLDTYGGTVAASFHISTSEGEFGTGNQQNLQDRIYNGCNINEPGFQPGEDSWVVTGEMEESAEGECIEIIRALTDTEGDESLSSDLLGEMVREIANHRIIMSPLYSPNQKEFFYTYVSTLNAMRDE